MSALCSDVVLHAVREWLQVMVLGENLCPFAGPVVAQGRLQLVHTGAATEEKLLEALASQLLWLEAHDETETAVLVHPEVLQKFADYNQFLDLADALLVEMNLDGTFQLASFHPEYQFAGTTSQDPENFANRAPYPLLHVLREDSVAAAVAGHPDIAGISARNIAHLEQIGTAELSSRLARWRPEPTPDV